MNEHELYKQALLENLADKERIRAEVLQSGARSARGRRPARRRLPLAIAACLMLGIALTIASPTARAKISLWINSLFTPQGYIATPREERTPIPALEEAITVVPKEEEKKPETTIRALEPAWAPLADELAISLEEAFYDGEYLHLGGTMHGGAVYLHSGWAYETIPKEHWFENELFFHFNGQAHPYTGNLYAFLPEELYSAYADASPQKRKEVLETLEAYRFTAEVLAPGLTGEQETEVRIELGPLMVIREDTYGTIMELSPKIEITITGLSFDATAGAAAASMLEAPAEAPLPDTAVSVLQFHDVDANAGAATLENTTLSLAGGTLRVVGIYRQLTGATIITETVLPEDWDPTLAEDFMKRVEFTILLNGREIGGFGEAYSGIGGAGEVYQNSDPRAHVLAMSEIRILLGDWDAVETIELQMAYSKVISYNNTTLEDDVPVTTSYKSDGWKEGSELIAIEGATITIPLE